MIVVYIELKKVASTRYIYRVLKGRYDQIWIQSLT